MSVNNAFQHLRRVETAVVHPDSNERNARTHEVISSWERCLQGFQIEPGNHPRTLVVDTHDLKQRRARLGGILDIARLEMENLYQQIAGSGFAIILTDHDGVIVNYIGDPTLEKEFYHSGLMIGAQWDENNEGTNGIGTCIAERTSVTIHRDDHFYSHNTGLTCSGAPIFDTSGQLMAVLDASSVNTRDTKESQFHTLALVNMSARMIENCNFLRAHPDDWILRFHSRSEYVGLLNEAIVVVDNGGSIKALNISAKHQLECREQNELIGTPIETVFDITPSMMRDYAVQRSHTVWPLRRRDDGRRYWAMLRSPQRFKEVGGITATKNGEIAVPSTGKLKQLSLHSLAGDDPRMAYNVRCAERVINKGINIILNGETGTGKEAFSRAMHDASERAENPFVAVNCASIPESLIESELFGYKHGAFTGARKEGMRGKILQSNGGTLFLDEIGDMPPQLQTRLLRVLEEKEVLPLGCDKPITVDLHVISATHRDLPALVADGTFREDLYYRLNGITLALPPLRDREDRDNLVRFALAAENQSDGDVSIDEAAFRVLLSYPWPGNIRQLRNTLRTALALCDDGVIHIADLPADIVSAVQSGGSDSTAPAGRKGDNVSAEPQNPLLCAEKEALMTALESNRWNITNTAESLNMSRNTLYRKMKRHGIFNPDS